MRGATTGHRLKITVRVFQPTRPLRGATIAPVATSESIEISTHAPLAGRDDIKVSGAAGKGYFNPRAPCGARQMSYQAMNQAMEFQPTRPLRGATRARPSTRRKAANFNPRAPCGARPSFFTSIPETTEFQPTRPLRGATCTHRIFGHESGISTHAPLAGRDHTENHSAETEENFNPRAPCGARHVSDYG